MGPQPASQVTDSNVEQLVRLFMDRVGNVADDEPASQLHRDPGGAHRLSIPDGQSGDGESQVSNGRAEKAN